MTSYCLVRIPYSFRRLALRYLQRVSAPRGRRVNGRSLGLRKGPYLSANEINNE